MRAELPRLGAVGLDTFEVEPLPRAHWAWDHPKVVMTPHMGRSPEGIERRYFLLFEENLSRWTRGDSLLNVVDREAGY